MSATVTSAHSGMKTCKRCGETKSLEEYHKHPRSKDRRQRLCKVCNNAESSKRIAADPEHYRVNKRRSTFKLRYGITIDQYNDLLKSQCGCCAVCGTDTPGGRGDFHVDHDHETGEVRGILCHACNVGIGNLKDSVEILEKALLYLKGDAVFKQESECLACEA